MKPKWEMPAIPPFLIDEDMFGNQKFLVWEYQNAEIRLYWSQLFEEIFKDDPWKVDYFKVKDRVYTLILTFDYGKGTSFEQLQISLKRDFDVSNALIVKILNDLQQETAIIENMPGRFQAL